LDIAVALDRGVAVDGTFGFGDLLIDAAQGAPGPRFSVQIPANPHTEPQVNRPQSPENPKREPSQVLHPLTPGTHTIVIDTDPNDPDTITTTIVVQPGR
jgi:hypothetical protein